MSVEAELIQKVEEWKAKANDEADPFDRYLSAFIAYNIFYNLYAKRVANNFIDDFTAGDSHRAAQVVFLADPKQLFDEIGADLAEYLKIIPVFREEYWPREVINNKLRGIPIAQTLKESFHNHDEARTVDLLAKWLYKVRCNLVHGVKSYKDDHQRELLGQSSVLLDKFLSHLLIRYKQVFI